MVYLDNAATSFPKPAGVVEAVRDFMLYAGANPGRSGHRLALAAGRTVDKARRSLAQLLQVEDEADLFFGLNCTDMLNTGHPGHRGAWLGGCHHHLGAQFGPAAAQRAAKPRPHHPAHGGHHRKGHDEADQAGGHHPCLQRHRRHPTHRVHRRPLPDAGGAAAGGRRPRRPACCPCIRSCGASTWWPCPGIRASWAPWHRRALCPQGPSPSAPAPGRNGHLLRLGVAAPGKARAL